MTSLNDESRQRSSQDISVDPFNIAKPHQSVRAIVLLYIVLGGLWILFSDQLLAFFVKDQQMQIRVSIYKGWFFVLITGMMLYGLVSRLTAKLAEDIIERQQAQEKIRKLNEDLEHQVMDRTAKLEAANKELEAFSYSVSHDLRAPLRTIDGFSHMLMEDYGDKLSDQGKEYLSQIRKGCQRMGQLIEDLLNLSRVTRNKLIRKKIDLGALAREILANYQANEPDRKVEITFAEEVMVDADENLMRIVLENLLGNAWKFTRKQPHPKIEFGVSRQGNETVYFIRDNGAGFDMAFADKLFSSFQRLHSQQEYEGSGIGLTIVQRIIHRHGGRIWAQAQINQGATFFFTLS